MFPEFLKYPRTRHLEGSRLQPGDHDLSAEPFSVLRDQFVVVEEKLDGANSALSFDASGKLWLQSRGHFLGGGFRERHFDLLKRWATAHQAALFERLGERYVVYGEWLYAKHTVFYDALPHYFLEFDVFDRQLRRFLSTARRRELLSGTVVQQVPVLFEGTLKSNEQLLSFLGRSRFKSAAWKSVLESAAAEKDVPLERAWKETDRSDEMEGLYVKVETADETIGRYKWVRAGFLSAVADSESHWQSRTIVPNRLAPGVVLP
ncbi:MAG: RNA ligase family protein [Myxococcaceae bacterium]